MSLTQILAFLAAHPNFATNHPGLMAHVDLDGDGYSGATDCDDRDPSVHPGAEDLAFDGIDQDCDDVFHCEFEVPQADGTIIVMPNEVRMTPSWHSPSGHANIDPNGQEVLRFDLHVLHPECPAVKLEHVGFDFNYTDTAQTGWQPHDVELVDLSIGWYATVGGPVQLGGDDSAPMLLTNVVIPGGSTHTFQVFANFTGASTSADDSVRVDIDGLNMIWTAMGSSSNIDDVLSGETLVF